MMKTPWINYHHLFYFMTIAESGSISKAAEALLLGQPTLSAQLKQFEETLGVQLFERQHRKLILTEHGQLALDYARNIFKMGGEMYEALHDRLRPTKISLQLGALDCIPKQVMLELTQSALNISPCSIALKEGRFEELMMELLAHRIDLVISNFLPQLEATKGLFHRRISREPLAIYGSPGFKSLRKKFPQSLNGQPVVLPTYDSQMRYDLEHWFKLNQINVDVVAETQDIALKKLMATNGMAIIPAAAHSVQAQLKAGELILIGELQNLREEIYLISSQRKIDNPIAAELMRSFEL
jgi:LysR family transcriptional regulator, transcriptional activator of nhaA